MSEQKYFFKVLNSDMTNKVAPAKITYELGKWYHDKNGVMCQSGYHVTTDPDKWITDKSDIVCIAEAKRVITTQDDKSVCESIRLIGTVSKPAWAEYEKITQTALAEYEKIKQTAWAEYEKITQTALAEYRKIKQTALVKLWVKTKKECLNPSRKRAK